MLSYKLYVPPKPSLAYFLYLMVIDYYSKYRGIVFSWRPLVSQLTRVRTTLATSANPRTSKRPRTTNRPPNTPPPPIQYNNNSNQPRRRRRNANVLQKHARARALTRPSIHPSNVRSWRCHTTPPLFFSFFFLHFLLALQ